MQGFGNDLFSYPGAIGVSGVDEIDSEFDRTPKHSNRLVAVRRLHEQNPMLGLRGVRLGITIPGLFAMQVRAITRAAGKSHTVFLLDEPTSELDPIGKAEVFDAVRRLRDEQNVTIIMIEHAVEQLAEFADRIIVMDAGTILAEAPPRELFRNVDLFHRTGGERLPQVAELLFGLEQQGILTSAQFTPYEAEAVSVLNQTIGARDV